MLFYRWLPHFLGWAIEEYKWWDRGWNLKLVNECCTSHIGPTTLIDDEFTYFASNSAPGVEDLLRLARFKGTSLAWRAFWITNSSLTSGVSKVWSSSLYSSLLSSPSIAWISSTSLIDSVLSLGEFTWKCLQPCHLKHFLPSSLLGGSLVFPLRLSKALIGVGEG